MQNEKLSREEYRRPEVTTLTANQVVEALGPVSAGSAAPCGPMLANFCL